MTPADHRRLYAEYLALGLTPSQIARLLSAYPIDDRPLPTPTTARPSGFEYRDVVRPGVGVGS